MHTSEALDRGDFSIALDGRPATIEDVLPGFDMDARVAIVSRSPGAPLGAATMLLALVTAWYEQRIRRAAGEGFYEYPDYYLVQVGGEHADLGMLEIWPPRKHVVVEADAEQILGALSDRSINYLLVEEGEPHAGLVLRETRNALPRHLRAALAYAPDGDALGADVVVTGSPRSEAIMAQAVADSATVSAAVRDACGVARPSTEGLRRVDLDTALGLLCPPAGTEVARPFGFSARQREVARLTDGFPRKLLAPIGPREDGR